MKDAIARFKRFLEHRYPNRSTSKHYMSDLSIFTKSVGDVPPQTITVRDIDAFVQTQSAQGLQAATINRRISTLSSFFEFLISESDDDSLRNPVYWKRHSVRPGHRLPRDVSDETVSKLLSSVTDSRARTMVTLMVSAGLRTSEALNLRLGDCDLNGQRLRVQSGKGDRDRVIPMTPHLVSVLQAYLTVREPAATDHLLIYKGAPVKLHLLPDRLRTFGRKADIESVTPHRLRHTFATFLINQGMPITSLQKLLGHQDINKTLIYARVYDETVRAQFDSATTQMESVPLTDWTAQFVHPNTPTAIPANEICDSV